MPNREIQIIAENIKTRIVPHGWREAGIYLLTLNVNGRKPLLGRLEGTPEKARIEATELGVRVSQEIQHISSYYPQIQVLAKQLMPDHLHVVLYVKELLPVAIGLVVRGLKQGCNRAVREIAIAAERRALAAIQSPSGMTGNADVTKAAMGALAAIQSPNEATGNADVTKAAMGALAAIQSPNGTTGNKGAGMIQSGALFETGYHVRALLEKGQLRNMIDYVHDNPRRLAEIIANRDYFRIQRNVTIIGRRFDAVGNMDLLKGRCMAVVCHGGWSSKEYNTYREERIALAKAGGAVVGAFISKPESNIREEAIEAGGAVVLLVENGFPERYKPTGRWFDLCAEGRLLLLAPWAYRDTPHTISREQCLQLNRMAEEIEAGCA